MKYIRTKEGRIIDLRSATKRQYEAFLHAYEVIKKSYTLEELCDEFVTYQEAYRKPVSFPIDSKMFGLMKSMVVSAINSDTVMDCWMKLAIWTDKGLIYVAKLNKKGEWELL